MKELLLKLGITAGFALPLSLAVQNPATALSFNFSFNNALNEGGTVTGVIRGLEEGTGAADSVEVLTSTLEFATGEYVLNPPLVTNTWTVLGGEIVAFDFFSSGIYMPPGPRATLFFDSSSVLGATFRAGLSSTAVLVTGSSNVTTQDIGLTFKRIQDPPAVPTPALLPGLVGMGIAALRKRKQEKAKAVKM